MSPHYSRICPHDMGRTSLCHSHHSTALLPQPLCPPGQISTPVPEAVPGLSLSPLPPPAPPATGTREPCYFKPRACSRHQSHACLGNHSRKEPWRSLPACRDTPTCIPLGPCRASVLSQDVLPKLLNKPKMGRHACLCHLSLWGVNLQPVLKPT